jgi:hypothetical protein
MQISRLVYSAMLNMEAKCSSETSVDSQRTTRRYIPEDSAVDQEHYVFTVKIFSCAYTAVGVRYGDFFQTQEIFCRIRPPPPPPDIETSTGYRGVPEGDFLSFLRCVCVKTIIKR